MRAVLLITIAVLSASAQTPDYARAERFMPYDVTPLPKGPEYVTVDAPHATRETSSKAPAQAPDKRRTAFIRDYNLWVRDAAGKETQLTTDGANKDFDLLMLPNRGHGFGNDAYMVRRWDYFVRYLLGAEPPKGYQLYAPPSSGRMPPAVTE